VGRSIKVHKNSSSLDGIFNSIFSEVFNGMSACRIFIAPFNTFPWVMESKFNVWDGFFVIFLSFVYFSVNKGFWVSGKLMEVFDTSLNFIFFSVNKVTEEPEVLEVGVGGSIKLLERDIDVTVGIDLLDVDVLGVEIIVGRVMILLSHEFLEVGVGRSIKLLKRDIDVTLGFDVLDVDILGVEMIVSRIVILLEHHVLEIGVGRSVKLLKISLLVAGCSIAKVLHVAVG